MFRQKTYRLPHWNVEITASDAAKFCYDKAIAIISHYFAAIWAAGGESGWSRYEEAKKRSLMTYAVCRAGPSSEVRA